MTKLHNFKANEEQEIHPDDEDRLDSDPDFLKDYLPQEEEHQGRYQAHIPAGHRPYQAAAMVLSAAARGKEGDEKLLANVRGINEIARRHFQRGPRGQAEWRRSAGQTQPPVPTGARAARVIEAPTPASEPPKEGKK